MIVQNRSWVRNGCGAIIGSIESDSEGNKICRKFGGTILGMYDARLDVTREFGGRIVARGDNVASFLNEYMK